MGRSKEGNMKRLFFIALILLFTLPCQAQDLARMNVGILGGGVPAGAPACTTSNDADLNFTGLYGNSDDALDNFASIVKMASKFVVGAGGVRVTSYILRVYNPLAESNVTIGIQGDNAGNPDGSYITGTTVLLTPVLIDTTLADYTVDLPASVALAAGTYHLVATRSEVSYIGWESDYTSTGGTQEIYTTSWASTADRTFRAKIYGCAP